MPLRWLFIDMNSYFASVEQQDRPECRGRPTVVAPVDADTTCAIAASYEAKALGIKTGTAIWQARQICPGLRVVIARPQRYVQVHHAIVEAVESCLPVQAVHSIDEMSCRLASNERQPDRAVELARRIKQAIRDRVGEYLRCSIGIAPNCFLAKVATDMQKPDGLVVLNESDLPQALYSLELTDLPGIARRMHRRLLSHGVGTVRQLCQCSEQDLRRIWNGVVGSWWWHWLRGYDLPEKATHRRTVGHSHVLPPQYRTDAGARGVLVRLIHRAAARLRGIGYWAGRMNVCIFYGRYVPAWRCDIALGLCQDTLTMLQAFAQACERHPRPAAAPIQVAVTLYNLVAGQCAALPLFEQEQRRVKLACAMDRANRKFGPHSLYFAAMHDAKDAAPTRISFTQIPEFEPEVL